MQDKPGEEAAGEAGGVHDDDLKVDLVSFIQKKTTYSVKRKCWIDTVFNGIELEVKERVIKSYRVYPNP